MTTSRGNELERYSFSKLSSWYTCPLMWKYTYIDNKPQDENAFAQYGTFVHSILERYAKGELDFAELSDIYENEYKDNVTVEFPPNSFVDLSERYYEQGKDFFNQFWGYSDKKIIAAEEKFEIELDDFIFNGIIDLVFEEDGNLIIRDYKSKAKFKSRAELKEYARQMYLYSLYVKEKYGKYPSELQFLMFRTNELVSIEFSEDALREAIEWAKETVSQIRNAWAYENKEPDFFCDAICSYRNNCEALIEDDIKITEE